MSEQTNERTIGSLLRDLSTNVTGLVQNEVQLAKAEMSEKTGQVGGAVLKIAGGFILALAGLIILLDALVYGLANHIPAWVAAIIVGGVVAAVALILVYSGQSDLKASNLAPKRTIKNVQKDAALAREQVQ